MRKSQISVLIPVSNDFANKINQFRQEAEAKGDQELDDFFTAVGDRINDIKD